MNRETIIFNADNEHFEALKAPQGKCHKISDTCKDSFSFSTWSAVAEDCTPKTQSVMEVENNTNHLHHQDDENLQADSMQHKTHMQYTNNNRAVPLGTDKKRGRTFRRHVRSVEHDRLSHPYAADTQMKVLHNGRWEESIHNSPYQQSEELTPGLLYMMVSQTVSVNVIALQNMIMRSKLEEKRINKQTNKIIIIIKMKDPEDQ